MTDFHSHILPGIDDGSKSLEESLQLIKMYKEQGITDIILTPHFYPSDETLEGFLNKLNSAFSEFSNNLKNKALPKVYKGCEVLYFSGLGRSDSLKRLCLNGSRYILLELFNTVIGECFFEDIRYMTEQNGIIPLIAHIERYASFKNYKELLLFCETEGIPVQINAESFLNFSQRRIISKILKYDLKCVISTDTHSIGARPPVYKQAMEVIVSKFGEETKNRFLNNAKSLFKEIDR